MGRWLKASDTNSLSTRFESFGSSGPSEEDEEREDTNEVLLSLAVVKLGSCLINETR